MTFFVGNRKRPLENTHAASLAPSFPSAGELYAVLKEDILEGSVNPDVKIDTERDETDMDS